MGSVLTDRGTPTTGTVLWNEKPHVAASVFPDVAHPKRKGEGQVTGQVDRMTTVSVTKG